MATGNDVLVPYQPSQRYYVLDAGRVADADLPAGNLVSALIDIEQTRDTEHLPKAFGKLVRLLETQADDHLRRAFVSWIHQTTLFAGRLPSSAGDPLTQLQETLTMLEETVREWTRKWLAQGIEQGIERGIEQGRPEERTLLCRQATRKFDARAGEALAAALAGVTDPDRLARVGDWIIECATATELLARVRDYNPSAD